MILQPADIILFRVGPASTWLDRAIGRCQKWIGQAPTVMQYCHVGIVAPYDATMCGPGITNTIIEARFPHVKKGPLDLPDLLKRNPIDFYRINGISADDQMAIVAEAQRDVDNKAPYDLPEIFSLGYIQIGHGLVCSQYAWRWVLNGCGLALCKDTSLISPDDIASSKITTKL